jgi:glycosyltransferase involved in cell wall biosynthesis
MRIAIDIRKINEFGVGTYIWNLVRNLGTVDTVNEYLLIGSEQSYQELGELPANFTPLLQPERGSLWRDQYMLPLALRRHKVDVVHVTHHESIISVPARLVVTIHDCVHVLFPPENLSRLRNYRRLLHAKRVVHRANQVIAVSNSTKHDVINIFDIAPEKINVIHNALDNRFTLMTASETPAQVLEKYQLKDPLFCIPAVSGHTKPAPVIEAFAVLKNELGDNPAWRNLKLIIIGDELSQHQYLRLTVVRSGVQQDCPLLWLCAVSRSSRVLQVCGAVCVSVVVRRVRSAASGSDG